MMEQYMAIKEQHKDCILFYRLGDFYEMFFDDAITASKELEITLTAKNCGLEEKAPMCGVPYHSAENYISRLIDKSYKVAIAEQVEDPATAKGIVKREVVRIVTPGANLNMQSLDARKNNYLMAICGDVNRYGLSYVDLTTGDFYCTVLHHISDVKNEIAKVQPSECILEETFSERVEFVSWMREDMGIFINTHPSWYFDYKTCTDTLKRHFNVMTLSGLGLDKNEESVNAGGALITYLHETQKSNLDHIRHIQYYEVSDYMLLDMATRRNLELVETMREKSKRGSLLWVLDQTKTSMGARRLRQYVEEPLTKVEDMERRLDAVGEFVEDMMLREEARELLAPIYDMERLMTKMTLMTANPRDLLAFCQSIDMLSAIKQLMEGASSDTLLQIGQQLDTLSDLKTLIESAIDEEAPIQSKEGKIIKAGYNEDVDRLRSASRDGKQWLATLEAKEREATGIKNMKIKYNKVFGYYLEVTKSNLHMVPDRYIRKQTLANAERYITEELKEIENTVLGAQDKLVSLEYDLFVAVREEMAKNASRIKKSAECIKTLDALQSLAHVAVNLRYTRPTFNTAGTIDIKEGRHPVIEKMMGQQFIPNDTRLDNGSHRFSIITGPNMAGKSTYMRQVALITLMAQIGSYVPAGHALISPVDRIFTRVGASDDLASGKSTFMVEMSEVANILRNATRNSLVILDEIGRGTSTFDGLSIAWAVVEFLVDRNKIGAKTLFATHYHELTELEGTIDGVENYYITVKEKEDDIIFLRKIAKGGADKSYGIQVAQLAGVPREVIARSKAILAELSDADITQKTRDLLHDVAGVQMDLFTPQPVVKSAVEEKLKEMNVNELTPIQALNLIYELKQLVENKSVD